MSSETEDPTKTPVESDSDAYEYRCPFCSETYGNELLARVHVTRSQDKDHLNFDGMMPEAEIEIIGEDGTIETRVLDGTEEINLNQLSINDIPDEHSDQHKHIILAAAKNPYEDTFQELKSKADIALKDAGLETLSYSTVRRVIREFFRPQEVRAEQQAAAEQEEDSEETLSDLTPKQQAIVIAHLVHPDESTLEIANRVGSAKSYPPQVYDRAEDIIDRLSDKIDGGNGVIPTILADLTPDDVETLSKHAHMENIGVDLMEAIEDDSLTPNDEIWDQPITGGYATPMSANPYNEKKDANLYAWDKSDETEEVMQPPSKEIQPPEPEVDELVVEDESATDRVGEEEPEAESVDIDGGVETADDAAEGTDVQGESGIPRNEIVELRQQLRFMRETLERTSETSDATDSKAYALAQQVEQELDRLLDRTADQ